MLIISQPPLILASSSPYRRELLSRLKLEFSTISPEVDETPLDGEMADELVQRLAKSKVMKIAETHPQHCIIGSDQVMSCQGETLGKPGNHARAKQQLEKMSGHNVNFSTGLSLYYPDRKNTVESVVHFEVTFRSLGSEEIERYLQAEQPYDCAGSFKSEQLGITLSSAMQGSDPTALIGLPLIELSRLLRDAGYLLP